MMCRLSGVNVVMNCSPVGWPNVSIRWPVVVFQSFHRRVATGAGQHLAVRAEGDAVHGSVVALECVQQLAGFCVPKLDEPIVAGSAQALAVRRKRNPIQGIRDGLA